MKLKFLGTADSAGILVHNCDCIIRKKNKINLFTTLYFIQYINKL